MYFLLYITKIAWISSLLISFVGHMLSEYIIFFPPKSSLYKDVLPFIYELLNLHFLFYFSYSKVERQRVCGGDHYQIFLPFNILNPSYAMLNPFEIVPKLVYIYVPLVLNQTIISKNNFENINYIIIKKNLLFIN